MALPSLAMPALIPLESEPTPAITVAPSARQRRKIRKPRKPPFRLLRKSRQAKRRIGETAIRLLTQAQRAVGRTDRCLAFLRHDAAIAEMDDAVATRGQAGIMGDENEGRASRAGEIENQLHHP